MRDGFALYSIWDELNHAMAMCLAGIIVAAGLCGTIVFALCSEPHLALISFVTCVNCLLIATQIQK